MIDLRTKLPTFHIAADVAVKNRLMGDAQPLPSVATA
jgi:hypothetical protein